MHDGADFSAIAILGNHRQLRGTKTMMKHLAIGWHNPRIKLAGPNFFTHRLKRCLELRV